MKRRSTSSGDDNQPAGKQRKVSHLEVDDVFDSPSSRRFISNILQNGGDAGYILGSVFMTWDKEFRMVIKTMESEVGDNTVKVEVVFKSRCAAMLKERCVKFSTQDEIMLALKGATFSQKKTSSNSLGVLEYRKGVAIKFLGRNSESSVIVDTWTHASPSNDSLTEDWFDPPPMVEAVSSAALIGTSASSNAVPKRKNSSPTPPLVSDRDGSDKPTTVTLLEETPAKDLSPTEQNPLMRRPTKKQRKNMRSEQYHRTRVAQAQASCETTTPNLDSNATVSGPSTESVSPDIAEPPTSASIEETKTVVKQTPAPGPAHLQAGHIFRHIKYTALKDTTTPGTLYSVAAVVVSATEPKFTNSRVPDLSVSLGLVDPSIRMLDDNSYLSQYSFKVNCFTPKHEAWLPRPKVGDVILLHQLKNSKFNDTHNLVGYGDKLKWAIYNPETHSTHHGDNPEPQRDRLGRDNEGPFFSPFYVLQDSHEELEYCSKLHKWWLALEEEKQKLLGNVIQLGDGNPSPSRTPRPHLLIKDAYPKNENPTGESFGFFDCTVELIHKYKPSEKNYWELYVTDYTSNENSYCYTYPWCPQGLGSSILRVELWDAACKQGDTLVKGSFYSIKNVKMRRPPGGHYEGKLNDPKITNLSEKNTRNPFLQALLERKAQWDGSHGGQREVSELQYVKIENVNMLQRFNCVLEVLHTGDKPTSSTRSDIYVTDYTSNTLLSDTTCDVPHAQNLRGRILKIALHDAQVENARPLKVGDVCAFLKLRLQTSLGEVVAYLGGEAVLIRRLNPGLPSHKQLMGDLHRERNLWRSAIHESPASVPVASTSQLASSSVKPRRSCSTIKEVEASESYGITHVIAAKVISCQPAQFEDFIYRRCSKCEEDIPKTQKACVKCDDMEHEYIQLHFRFGILLEDEEGSRLPLFTPNNCLALRDVRRADLRIDRAAYAEFLARFQTFAGNVLSYYEDRMNGIDTELDTPMMYFEVVKEAGPRYWFWSFEPMH